MNKNTEFIPALRFSWLTKAFDPFLRLTMPERKFKKDLLLQGVLKENEVVLDFGCGTGTLVMMIKEMLKEVAVFGVDVDKKVLEIAREKIGNAGYEISLNEYDSVTLPYENGSFDKVFSSLVFHHLKREQKINAIKEIYRVLKNDGEFHLLDFGKAQNIFTRSIFFIPQLLDGFENTQDNVNGLLPYFMKNAGFSGVVETKRLVTIFGSMSLYKAKKVL